MAGISSLLKGPWFGSRLLEIKVQVQSRPCSCLALCFSSIVCYSIHAVTTRATSKSAESTKKRWQAAGAKSHSIANAPSSSLLPNWDTASHMATQHALLFPVISKGLWVEQKGTRGCEGRNANSNCSVSNVSISLNAPICEMQSSPFRLEPC